MKCPHCKKNIDDKLIGKHLASKGGSKSKRSISPIAQKKLQDARKAKKEKG